MITSRQNFRPAAGSRGIFFSSLGNAVFSEDGPEQETVDGTQEPYLHAKGEHPVDGHLTDGLVSIGGRKVSSRSSA